MTADGALKGLGPFTSGVNNVAPTTKPPVDQNGQITSLREAVNVDLDSAGRPQRRRGYNTEVNGVSHSLFATESNLLGVVDGSLNAYTDDSGTLELAAAIRTVGDRFVSMTTDDADVYWSNGVEIGRIDGLLNDLPVWIDTPNPVSLAATPAGGLAAGNYEVSVTAVDPTARESGASNPVVVTLTAGQGIAVTLPAQPSDTFGWNVYATPPDGEAAYLVAQLPSNATTYAIGAHTPGRALETAWLFPMVPCQILRYGHGRLVGLTSDSIVWSQPYTLGLMHDQNNMGLTRGTMLEPVGEGGDGAGWYVSDFKRVYFLAGSDPSKAQQIVRCGSPAVPGTSMTLSGEVFGLETTAPVAFWLGANGTFYLGLPGGTVKAIRKDELALPVDAERGAVEFFAFDGIAQIITSIYGGQDNPMNVGVGDLADATIRRNGVTL